MQNFRSASLVLLFISILTTSSLFSQTYLVDNYGAVGDGVTDDRDAIQNAIWDLQGTGGTLQFASGKTYIISTGLNFYNFSDTHHYLVTTTSTEKAVIKIQDGAALNWYHWGFRLSDSRNITLDNLTIDGNRDTRNPTIETSGTDVLFIDGACNGTRLKNLNLINSPMDNLYIVVHENSGQTQMTDFEMHNCKLENGFRNNMSVISGENFKIIGCEFNNANGTDPQSGIDFEPNTNSTNGYKNMKVEGCAFKNNVRYGIELTYIIDSSGFSTLKNNYFENNGILVGSKNNIIHHNIFAKQDHQHLHTDQTRDGIIYFHANGNGQNNQVYNNYFYNNPMPPGSHLVNFMYNSGGNNHLFDNYGHGNIVDGFVLNNTWGGTPSQIISNNTFLTRKEMGYWSMDTNSVSGNTLADLSDFGNNGTLVNSPLPVAGKVNEAINFSPDNKYIEIDSSNSLNIEVNITLSAWINWNGVNAAEPEQVIIGRSNDWWFGINNSGQLGFYSPLSTDTSFTGGLIQADIADSIPPGDWKFVTFTYDGRYARLFIDAVELVSKQANGVIGTTNNKLYIGSLNADTGSFNGTIDEVKILNYALSQQEIEGLKGVNYYVDYTSGNDLNKGTSHATAWKTINKVNDEMENFMAGDSILFKRGEIWNSERLSVEDISGSELNDIVFGAYGSGAKPVFNSVVIQPHSWSNVSGNIWKANNPPAEHPERMLIDGVEKLRANIFSEMDGINFFWWYDNANQNLYIFYATDPNGVTEIKYATDFPVIVESAGHVKFENIDLQGGWTGMFLSTNSKNITLDSMSIGKYCQNGVVTNTDSVNSTYFPENITISNCYFDAFFAFDYSMAGSYHGSSDRGCGDGIRTHALKTGEIKNCYFKNWGHASIGFDGGSYIKVSEVKVSENYMTSPDICYGGRIGIDDAINCEIYNNQIVNTTVQSQLNGQCNHYHHNIFDGTTDTPLVADVVDAGIEMQGYSNQEVTQNVIENNVIVNTEGPGFRISGNNDYNIHHNIIKNNIIYNCGTTISGKSLVVESNEYGLTYNNSLLNNDVFSSSTTQTCDFRDTLYNVAGFNALSGTDGYTMSENMAGNPLFVDEPNDDFHLQSGSPCIDTGIESLSTKDYDNNPIPLQTAPDIGLYEYGAFWNGSISHYWNIADNWSSNQVPDTTSSVTIPSPNYYKFCPEVHHDVQIKKLYLNESSKIIINNSKLEIME